MQQVRPPDTRRVCRARPLNVVVVLLPVPRLRRVTDLVGVAGRGFGGADHLRERGADLVRVRRPAKGVAYDVE